VHGFGSNHLESSCWRYLDKNDTSDHTRVCGSLKASLLTHPTQAITAAPGARPVITGSYPHDRAGFGLSSRKGPDLGGGKVVGVTETVAISGLMSLFLQQKHVDQGSNNKKIVTINLAHISPALSFAV
jgi:hypothetical protein